MAVTKSVALETIKSEFILNFSANTSSNSSEVNPSIIALADGGYAVAYVVRDLTLPNQTDIYLERYTADGVFRPSASQGLADATLLNSILNSSEELDAPSITQLANGGILVTWTNGTGTNPGIHFAIVNSATGDVTTPDTLLSNTDATDFASDVIALKNGGFAVVKHDDNGGVTDQDSDLHFYNSAGVFQTSVALGNNSIKDERFPAVTVLANGNVAVAYEQETTDGSGVYGMNIEIYSQTGGLVLDQTPFDVLGQNLNSDIVALKDGGFAVAYQDTGTGAPAVSIAFFTASGTLRSIKRADPDSFGDADISISLLANGFVVLTWTDNGVDIAAQIFDPVTMLAIGPISTAVENQAGQQEEPAVAGLGNGTHITAWTDFNDAIADGNTDPDGAHVSMQIDAWVRTSAGDAAANTIVGDELIDKMFGQGGADRLFGAGGNDQLYGTTGDDYLSGGVGNDYLSGGDNNDTFFGGAGKDTMVGGAGNDSFYILAGDGSSDLIVELAGGGTADRIYSAVSYSLAASSQVETLSTNSNTGTSNINLAGSNSANTVIGNNGNNIINGLGGNDVLFGGSGTDYFVFGTAPNGATNFDRIGDWTSASDLIFLKSSIFTAIGAGTISAAEFRSGAGATSALNGTQNIIHNSTNGDLWYDSDGVGGVASVRFANVGAGNPIFHFDFFGI